MKITTAIAFYIFVLLISSNGLTAQDGTAKDSVRHIPTRMPDFKKMGKFADLQKRAEAMDTTVDFFNLRMSFTKTKMYHPDDSLLLPLKSRMLSLFDIHKFKEAALVGDSILRQDYCDMFTHLGMSKIYQRLKEPEVAKKYSFIFNGLLKSLLNSGDGMSPETAWMVISTQEEYFIVKYHGFALLSQTVLNSNNGPINIMSGGHGDKTEEFYFNISLLTEQRRKGK